MNLYCAVHSALVRGTPAYGRFAQDLREAVASHMAEPGPIAAVPSSTGDWLRPTAPLAHPLTLEDLDEETLKYAQRRIGRGELRQADLNQDLPLERDSQEVVICAHALHVLAEPDAVLRRIAAALRPGGHLVLATFERDEGVGAFARRVGSARGARTALAMLPWKALDRLWTTAASGYPDAAGVAGAIERAGLELVSQTATFAGTSTLSIARKPSSGAAGSSIPTNAAG